jgi:hypothetical protein
MAKLSEHLQHLAAARLITSGERWTWCYVHEIYGQLTEQGSKGNL